MAWARIDDTAPTHPKIIGLSDAAFRAWAESICYGTRHRTDGHIPRGAFRAITRAAETETELITAGLWEPSETGITIHDFHDYQLAAAEIDERRRLAPTSQLPRHVGKPVLPRERREPRRRVGESDLRSLPRPGRMSQREPSRNGRHLGRNERGRVSQGTPQAGRFRRGCATATTA